MEKILVVDDMGFCQILIENLLRPMGFVVSKANGGQEALTFLKNNPDVSIVICDLMMPDLDGFEVFKQIKAISSAQTSPSAPYSIEFVLFTSCCDNEQLKEMSDAGIEHILRKPVNPNHLQNVINTILEKRNQPPIQRPTALSLL